MKGQTVEITVVATFQVGGKAQQLETTASVLVASATDNDGTDHL